MNKTTFKLEKDYPILDWRTREFIRNLRPEDLDDAFAWELDHDNVREIILNHMDDVMYVTYESAWRTSYGEEGEKAIGDMGRYEVKKDLWDIYSFWYGISETGAHYVKRYDIYHCTNANTLWEATDKEHADRYATLYDGKEEKTFYFRRVWPKERNERGLPTSLISYVLEPEELKAGLVNGRYEKGNLLGIRNSFTGQCITRVNSGFKDLAEEDLEIINLAKKCLGEDTFKDMEDFCRSMGCDRNH